MKKALLALSSAVLLAACSSPSSQIPKDLEKYHSIAEPEVVWSKSVGESLTNFLVPAVVGQSVFAAGGDEVYRLNAENGDEIWSVEVDAPISAGVGSDGYTVAVGTEKGELVVLNGEGQRLWSQFMTSEIDAVPLVGHGLVIVRTADTRVTAFDATTGEQRWRYQRQAPTLTVKNASQMKFFGPMILVGQSNGFILGLSPQGRPVWQALISEARGITEVERLVDILGEPMANGDLLCATAFQGRLVCMDSQNGQLRWTHDVTAMTPPVADDRFVFVGNTASEIITFERNRGIPVWRADTFKWRGVRAMLPFAGVLAVTDQEGYVHFVNPESGEVIGRTDLDGAIVSTPQPYEQGAIFQTEEGEVAYIKVR
jgi:outer membrane protein assembly factor BamB